MTLAPETLLHLFAPYLPTDRFRALLGGQTLAESTHGAAMLVDISGFTPLTVRLVEEYGPQRASEELKRRLNPMFEAIAGLVFTHGGSVIRFVGDGFTAWFPDEAEHFKSLDQPLPGMVRASIAALEMLETMIFFRGMDLKVAVNSGMASRWVVGDAAFGLVDILGGAAVEGVAELAPRCQPHQVRTLRHNADTLHEFFALETLPDGDLLIKSCDPSLVEQSRLHRWQAWQATGNVEEIVEQVRQFIDPAIQEQETAGLGSLSGELRYATPVFLSFGGLDYNHDPEARQKLDRYVREVQKILSDTNGRLVSIEVADKGTVVFAVFGAPLAYGDDTRRAVHAALRFRDLPQHHAFVTNQSIGISRGLLYSGTVGGEVRHEYTSLGDETNIASRLMTADTEGRILVSQAAYDDCSEWFDFEQGESIQPKGRVGAVQTYIPLHAKQRVKRDLRKFPMVGREQELSRIHKAFETIGRGRPQILRVEGESGIGKSRLAAEIAFLAQESNCTVAVGYCLSTGRSIAFLPWRPLIRSLLKINDEWHASAQLAHLRQWVTQRSDHWENRLPLLSDLLDLEIEETPVTRSLAGSARQQALYAFLIDILYYLAKQTPLTLIIEDTHWIDEVSEALLIELGNRLSADAAPILLVLLHRPAQEAKHPTQMLEALSKLYIHHHHVLSELSEQAVSELLASRLGGIIPHELTLFAYEKSQGNPFFVQEIVGTLEENNAIKRIGPQVYIEADLEKINLPQTVQGLILSRLDNLSETEKIILKMASVIGRQFEIRVLYQSLPLEISPESVMEHLRGLEKKQYIHLESLYPEPLYSFRHAITQEVTYQTLLFDQRKQWHHNVGTILEILRPQSWERLAYHFVQTDDKQRAFMYLVHAGDKCAREFANQAALDYWAQALDLTRSYKEEFDLLCKRLELLMRTADSETIERDLERIIKLAEGAPLNLNWQLRKCRYQAEHALNIGDWHAARVYAEAGAEICETYQDLQIAWEIYSILARIYAYYHDRDAKQEVTYELRKIAIALKEPGKSVRLLLNDFMELADEDPHLALAGLENTYPQVMELGDPMVEANYWNSVSRIALQNLILVRAEEALRTQIRLWRQIGNRRMEGSAVYTLGIALYFLGKYSEAGAQFRESYSLASQVSDRRGEANCLMYLGALAFRRGAYGEAAAYIARSLNQFEALGIATQSARALLLLGQNELAQGNFLQARTYFQRCLYAYRDTHNYASLPQVELAHTFATAHLDDSIIIEDFESAILALTHKRFHIFHDPDIAFWQAHSLLKHIEEDTDPLRQAFQNYLDSILPTLPDEDSRQAFLDIGYTRRLVDQLNVSC